MELGRQLKPAKSKEEVMRAARLFDSALVYAKASSAAGFGHNTGPVIEAIEQLRKALLWAAGESDDFEEILMDLRRVGEFARRRGVPPD